MGSQHGYDISGGQAVRVHDQRFKWSSIIHTSFDPMPSSDAGGGLVEVKLVPSIVWPGGNNFMGGSIWTGRGQAVSGPNIPRLITIRVQQPSTSPRLPSPPTVGISPFQTATTLQPLCRKGYPHFFRVLHAPRVAVAKLPGSGCAAGIVAL